MLGARDAVKKRLAHAEAKLRRLRAAIEAGVDPVALVKSINAAQARRAAAQAELDGTPAPMLVEAAEIYARIDSLGDVGAVVAQGEPQEVMDLYAALDLQIQFDYHAHAADVIIKPVRPVNSECVRGPSCPKTPPSHVPLNCTFEGIRRLVPRPLAGTSNSPCATAARCYTPSGAITESDDWLPGVR
jgi:hypothetical protein